MSQLVLDRNARLLLQAKAHHLEPVVLLGGNGLTEAVIKEVDRALTAHGLIKVKVPSDDREERTAIFEELADKLGAAKITQIGKLLVLFRPIPEKEETQETPKVKKAAPAAARKTGAKARNNRKRLTEMIQNKNKEAKSLPWAKTVKKGKTPKGQVKAVGAKGKTLGSRLASKNKGISEEELPLSMHQLDVLDRNNFVFRQAPRGLYFHLVPFRLAD